MNRQDEVYCSRIRARFAPFLRAFLVACLALSVTTRSDVPIRASAPERASARGVAASVSCTAVSEIPLAECEALQTIYYSLDGPGWSYQDGWLQSHTPCRWIGVVCHGGHVTELSLGFNNLNGVLPGAVGDLPHLTSLNLIYNQIRGLPAELERLTALQSLFLSENNLASLPPEIGALVNLRELHLSGNPLTTLPPEIGELGELRELYLRIDSLWSLPEELAALSNLRVLHVSSPLLSEALPKMGNWTQLEVLSLSGCRLNVWPAELETLRTLRTLDLSHNHFVTLPDALGQLTSLRVLDLSDNTLASVPPEIAHLQFLTDLDLSQNELGVVPPELGELTALRSLNLSANRLATLPASLGNLTAIQNELHVDYNRLRTLPSRVQDGDLARTGWQSTQTVPPTDLHVESLSAQQVRLTWRPISYTGDSGYYEIMHTTVSSATAAVEDESAAFDDAGFQVIGKTTSKKVDAYVAEAPDPTRVHKWALRTYTPAHESQKNYLWSEPGAAVLYYVTDLRLNYSSGLPGTIFVATAKGFPPDTAVDIYANEVPLDILSTDAAGTLHFLIDTAEADVGDYTIRAVVGAEGISAHSMAPLTLSNEDFRDSPATLGYPTVSVPSGLINDQSALRQIYLPAIVR